MTAQKGKDLLLKLDETGIGTIVTVAGLRATRLSFNSDTVDVTTAESAGNWRELLAGAGLRVAAISGSGIFKDAASDAALRRVFFDGTIDHYLRVPFKLCQAAIPVMRKQGKGWIVNLGSLTAQRPFKPYDDFARLGGATVYAAIKAALARFMQGLAAEPAGAREIGFTHWPGPVPSGAGSEKEGTS